MSQERDKTWAEASQEERVRRLDDLLGPPPTEEQQAEAEREREALLAAVNEATPEVEWVSYGGACPEQGYGWWKATGEAAYFRYRHDTATLEVGPNRPDEDGGPMVDFDQVRLYSELNGVTGNSLDGATYDVEVTTLLLQVMVSTLRPKEEWANGTRKERVMAQLRQMLADF